MELSVSDLMGKLLEIVNDFLDRVFTNEKLTQDNQDKINKSFFIYIDELKKKNNDTNISTDDIYYKLQFFFQNWDDVKVVFNYKQVGRSYISILKDVRNQWAHRNPLSYEDLEYATNTSLRLSHLANDTQTILDLESIFEHISQQTIQSQTINPDELNDQPLVSTNEELSWKLYSFQKRTEILRDINPIRRPGIISEFLMFLFDKFCYPWANYQGYFFIFLNSLKGTKQCQGLLKLGKIQKDNPFPSEHGLDLYPPKLQILVDLMQPTSQKELVKFDYISSGPPNNPLLEALAIFLSAEDLSIIDDLGKSEYSYSKGSIENALSMINKVCY